MKEDEFPFPDLCAMVDGHMWLRPDLGRASASRRQGSHTFGSIGVTHLRDIGSGTAQLACLHGGSAKSAACFLCKRCQCVRPLVSLTCIHSGKEYTIFHISLCTKLQDSSLSTTRIVCATVVTSIPVVQCCVHDDAH